MESTWDAAAAISDPQEKARHVRSSDEVFLQLFERYYRPVVYFFARRGLSPEESQDFAQETFLRAYKNLDTLREGKAAKAWLFITATNLWRNEVRNRKAQKRIGTELPLDEGVVQPAAGSSGGGGSSGALAGLLARERVELLRQALEELPPRMHRCVLLRLDQELKYREIAVIMQVSVDTVKAQLHQAKERLKEALGEHFDGIDF